MNATINFHNLNYFLATTNLIDIYRQYLPATQENRGLDFEKTVFMCPAGHFAHPIPVVSMSIDIVKDHMLNGHQQEVPGEPISINLKEMNVPYVEIMQKNSYRVVQNREMRNPHRKKAAAFLKFAQMHSSCHRSSSAVNAWRSTNELSGQEMSELLRNASDEEMENIFAEV